MINQIQNNKQIVSSLKRKSSDNLETLLSPENGQNRIISRWTNDENMLAVKCINEFGKNYQKIADFIGTKNESHVRTWFAANRRKYNLDAIVKKFDAKQHDKELKNDQKLIKDNGENAIVSNKSNNNDKIMEVSKTKKKKKKI